MLYIKIVHHHNEDKQASKWRHMNNACINLIHKVRFAVHTHHTK